MTQDCFYFYNWLPISHVGLLTFTWPLNIKMFEIPSFSHAILSRRDVIQAHDFNCHQDNSDSHPTAYLHLLLIVSKAHQILQI